MKANDGQCINLVSFSASNYRAVVPTLLDRPLVHRRYLPNKVGTHLQLSILRQIGVNEIAYASQANHSLCGERTHDPRVLHPTP